MENCLVKKLKVSVDNNNLNKLGLFRIPMSKKSSLTQPYYVWYKEGEIPKGYLLDESGNVLSEMPYNTISNEHYFELNLSELDENVAYFECTKYNIKNISYTGGGSTESASEINIDDLLFSDIINIDSYVRIFKDTTKASDIAKLENLTSIKLYNKNDMGDIADLGALTHLTQIEIGGVSGKVEDFLVNQYNNDNTERDIILNLGDNYLVTFNNLHINSGTYARINTSGITVGTSQGASDLGTYDGSSWTFPS